MAVQTGYQEIARRYALAYFQLAREQNAVDKIAADIAELKGMLDHSGELKKFIHNAALKRSQEAHIMGVLADKMKVTPLTKKFFGTLAMNRRLGLLPLVIAAVEGEISRFKGEVTARVTSAQPLGSAQVASIAVALEKVLGLKVNVEQNQDASIMGGLVIQIGSQRIDSSVRSKLDRLHRVVKNPETSSTKAKKIREVA